jgi:hypothetical protein
MQGMIKMALLPMEESTEKKSILRIILTTTVVGAPGAALACCVIGGGHSDWLINWWSQRWRVRELKKQLNQAKKQARKQNQCKRRRWSSERKRKREEEIHYEGSSSLAVCNGALATSNDGTGIILGRGLPRQPRLRLWWTDGEGEGWVTSASFQGYTLWCSGGRL